MSAVHPRHGFFYKTGFIFAVVLLLSVLVFLIVVAAKLPISRPALYDIRMLIVASLFLTVVSFFVDSLQFKRWMWAAVDGLLSVIALIIAIRNTLP